MMLKIIAYLPIKQQLNIFQDLHYFQICVLSEFQDTQSCLETATLFCFVITDEYICEAAVHEEKHNS